MVTRLVPSGIIVSLFQSPARAGCRVLACRMREDSVGGGIADRKCTGVSSQSWPRSRGDAVQVDETVAEGRRGFGPDEAGLAARTTKISPMSCVHRRWETQVRRDHARAFAGCPLDPVPVRGQRPAGRQLQRKESTGGAVDTLSVISVSRLGTGSGTGGRAPCPETPPASGGCSEGLQRTTDDRRSR
jgi:hypothetical protein